MVNAISNFVQNYNFLVTFIGEVSTLEHSQNKEKVINQIAKKNLGNFVLLIDNVPYSEITKYYNSHDIFVLPASNEPASISILEAMAHGLPVICSDTCGTKTYVQDGYNGFIFKSDDVSSLTITLERFLSQPGIIAKMSDNSYNFAKSHISGDVYYDYFKYMLKKQFSVDIDNAIN